MKNHYYLIGAIICFITAILAVVIGAAQIHPSAAPDVFEPVQQFMPGQSVAVALSQPNCYSAFIPPYDGYHVYCSLKDSAFTMASMTLDRETETVEVLYLSVRSGHLRVGDLLRWFNVTRKVGRSSIKALTWDGGHAWCWVGRGHVLTAYTYVFGIRLEKSVS